MVPEFEDPALREVLHAPFRVIYQQQENQGHVVRRLHVHHHNVVVMSSWFRGYDWVARPTKCDTFYFGGLEVEVLWGHRNLEKIQAHGLEPEEVETAFNADDWATAPSELPYRFIGEGTSHSGRLVRVIYAETEDGLYPITAFPIRLRQRRTP
jgi:hypothetical protein